MKRAWLVMGVVAAFAGVRGIGAAETARPALVVVADHKSNYCIVVPNGPDPRDRVKQASDLLQKTVAEATGVTLPVVKEGALPAGASAIYLGATQAAQAAQLPLAEIKDWTILKQVKGADIFLAGLDAAAGVSGHDSIEFLGTLKAVTSFLEDEAGVRFLLPGPKGVFVPKLDRLTVPADLKVLRRPNFVYIIGRDSNDTVYSAANNFFCWSCTLKSHGGDIHSDAVPEAQYFKDHPEYFALIKGVRTGKNNHLCISNPNVQKLIVAQMLKDFDAGYQWDELGQTDGYVPCECDACKAINPDPGERLWIVHRKLAEEMKTLRPDRKVMILSYGPTMNPPKSFKDFPDNVVIEMCNYRPEAFDSWRPFNVEKTVFVYNWGLYNAPGFGPKRTPQYAADQIKRFVQNGVRGMYLCGGFESLGLQGPVYYTFGKCMGDPTLNATAVADDFYRAAYGAARAPMKAFFDAMYSRLELYSVLLRPNFRAEMSAVGTPGNPYSAWLTPSPVFNTPEDYYCYFFPAELIAEMGKNLEQAKGMDKDPRVQARLRLVEADFDYVRNLARIFQLYRAYRLAPSWEAFNVVAAEVDHRNALIDSRYDEQGRLKNSDGWGLLWQGVPKQYMKAGGDGDATLDDAPFNWNTKLIREKKVLP